MSLLRFITPSVIGLVGSLSFAGEPNCMQDLVEFGLQCTAKDVHTIEFNVLNGVTECVSGENVQLQLQAKQIAQAFERYDVGLFVALDGGNALTGQCFHDYLGAPLSTTSTPANTQRTSPHFDAEEDEDPADACGDIEKDVTTLKNLSQIITVKCEDTDGDQILDVSACTSWDNQKSAGTLNKSSCASASDTLPNTPSKCQCETVKVANVIVKGKIIIKKITVPNDDTTTLFTFHPTGWNGDAEFTLTGGTSKESEALAAGSYKIREKPVSGWATQSSCDDGSSISNISLQAGEVVTCTFVNMLRCPASRNCNDNNSCTADACDPETGDCVYENLSGTACGSANETECDARDLCVDGICVDRVKDEGIECRVSTGACDFAEVCNGISKICPADGPNSILECSASNGECDLAEFCSDNSDNCPADGGNLLIQCREAVGICDFAEFCSNASDSCPADGPNKTSICREAVGECDLEERCSNASDFCPGDVLQNDGTNCADADNNVCTLSACVAGSCRQDYAALDPNDNNACTLDVCDPLAGPSYSPIECDDGNICTNDLCEPQRGCVHSQVSCNDGDRCTEDTCVPGVGCVHRDVRQPAN